MTSKEFIESGILEEYVLLCLSEEDIQKVEAAMLEFPEVKAEVFALQEALLGYLPTQNPPPLLREKVLSSFTSDTQNTPSYKNYLLWGITLFSCVMMSICFVLWLNTKSELSKANEELSKTKTANQTLEKNLSTCESHCKALKTAHDKLIISDGCHSKVRLCHTNNKQTCAAVIYWNRENKTTYCEVNDLPKLPEGKEYHLWCIEDKAQKPIDAGVLDKKGEGLQMVHKYNSVAAFAVTIEPKGGGTRTTSPTPEEIMMFGTPEPTTHPK